MSSNGCNGDAAELRQDALLLAETVFLLNQNSRRSSDACSVAAEECEEGEGRAAGEEERAGMDKCDKSAGAVDGGGGAVKPSSISALLN